MPVNSQPSQWVGNGLIGGAKGAGRRPSSNPRDPHAEVRNAGARGHPGPRAIWAFEFTMAYGIEVKLKQ